MRWIGAVLIFACCGYIGFSMAMSHRKQERTLRQLQAAIDYMECELQYRLTPLPQLLEQAAKQAGGTVKAVLTALSTELEDQISPEVACCMESVLCKQRDVPEHSREAFRVLGQSLGRFDLQGQLKELDSVRQFCSEHLSALLSNRDVRLRSYQTLGLCAGAAIAILLL